VLIFDVTDYGAVGDGRTDDTAAIQAALDAAAEAGGGIVTVPAGTFIVSGTGHAAAGALQVSANTELRGAGMGETVIKLADGSSVKISGLIRTTPSGDPEHDIVIRDLTVDGNKANTTGEVDGIMTGYKPGDPDYEDNILIDSVEVMNCSRIGFNPHEQTHNLTVRNCVAHDNDWDGFVADYCEQAVYENNVAYDNGRHGFNVVTRSSDVILRDNVSYGNAEDGIVVQRGSADTTYTQRVLVENNLVYDNGIHGIELKRVNDSQVLDNTIRDNGEDGIHVEASWRNVIAGNLIENNSRAESGKHDGIEIGRYTGSDPGPRTAGDNLVIDNVISADEARGDNAISEDRTGVSGNVFAGNSWSGSFRGSADHTLAGQEASADGYSYIRIADTRAESPDQLAARFTADPGRGLGDAAAEAAQLLVGSSVSERLEGGLGDDALYGAGGDDIVMGDAGSDLLRGDAGNDVLQGGDGDDTLYGNDGRDVLIGGLGADIMTGSFGGDTFVWTDAAEGGDTIVDFRLGDRLDLSELFPAFHGSVLEAAAAGLVRLVQNGTDVTLQVDLDGSAGDAEGWTTLATLKNVTTDAVDIRQVILGDAPNAAPTVDGLMLVGSAGADDLVANDGDSRLNGSSGDSRLTGGVGDDILFGGAGDDVLVGNGGNDMLRGGLGADTLVFNPHHGWDIVDSLRGDDTLSVHHALFASEAEVRAAIATVDGGLYLETGADSGILFQNTALSDFDQATILIA
jgi:parallel beta-helix repeat protein